MFRKVEFGLIGFGMMQPDFLLGFSLGVDSDPDPEVKGFGIEEYSFCSGLSCLQMSIVG